MTVTLYLIDLPKIRLFSGIGIRACFFQFLSYHFILLRCLFNSDLCKSFLYCVAHFMKQVFLIKISALTMVVTVQEFEVLGTALHECLRIMLYYLYISIYVYVYQVTQSAIVILNMRYSITAFNNTITSLYFREWPATDLKLPCDLVFGLSSSSSLI